MVMEKGASDKTTYLMTRVLHNPHLWVVAVMMTLLVIVHYYEVFGDVLILGRIGSILEFGLTRQTLWRILFLVPVTYGAAVLGTAGGISILVLSAAAMLPRVFLISPAPREVLFETGGVVFTGVLIVTLFYFMQKGRQRLAELETTQDLLNLQIKRLGMLYVISNIVSSRVAPLGSAFGIQSPEPRQFLAVIDKVGQLLEVDSAWLYLWDEEERILRLAASSGLSESVAQELGLGEGLDGVAAQSRQPIVIKNVSADPIFRSAILRPEGLQSVLVVPFISNKGEVEGTLGAGTHLVHHFSSDEVDLLRAIGDQISMAVENARLYQKERLIAEALRVSERNYRELFENASDAIWVHDLSGTIIAANKADEKLSGFTLQELLGKNVREFLTDESLNKAREVRPKLLAGEEIARPYEQRLVNKDGNHVIIQLSTSLITKDGQPWAFQNIARDITEEKGIQDDLRFYVQQVSQAQEAERKRIARELHDETAQALIAVSRNLDDLASGNSQLTIKDIREQVRKILREVRYFSQQLRPSILDDLGLLPAVRWLASDLTRSYGIAGDVEVVGEQRQLPSEAELMLFRIVQEALANVRRHSEANRVCVRVEFADQKTKVTVNDNGKGFEMPARVGDLARIGKLGLTGMQERAKLLGGDLTIDSKPGKGTTVTVKVPL
jgi:PAS domain S-box-containing protein